MSRLFRHRGRILQGKIQTTGRTRCSRGRYPQQMLKPRLVSIVALDGRDDGALLALAAGAARGLEAPLGAAILESARERDVALPAVDLLHETTGAGVVA